jgi:uncharacterized protein (TIGR03000 family)
MSRTALKCLLAGAVVAVVLSLAVQADAQCWGCYRPVTWGCCWAPRCVTPCYTCYSPCYSGCYDGGCYLGWRPGPVRRLLLGPYRWYGCGYSGGCWSNCCWSGCGPTYDCCTGVSPAQPPRTPTPANKPVVEPPAAMPTEPAPVLSAPGATPAPPPVVPPPTSMPKTSGISADQSGILTVWVPYDAKVFVNGYETRSVGSKRQFVSYGLKPGLTYKYEIRAQVVRDGKIVEDARTVALTAGQAQSVAFGFNTLPAEQVAAR